MNDLSPKERISRVLEKKSVDRPPVICPGGMMNAAIVEVMTKTGHTLPEGHLRGDLMADLASYVHQNTGFENLGVPFCMASTRLAALSMLRQSAPAATISSQI
ncbi:MAG TPA: uroporphyrinogen decarboxylase family protein, partial [Bacillota bacterium]|nr:uroporphyrinogen decarboxylase family protein [Bacillota bacterium]